MEIACHCSTCLFCLKFALRLKKIYLHHYVWEKIFIFSSIYFKDEMMPASSLTTSQNISNFQKRKKRRSHPKLLRVNINCNIVNIQMSPTINIAELLIIESKDNLNTVWKWWWHWQRQIEYFSQCTVDTGGRHRRFCKATYWL